MSFVLFCPVSCNLARNYAYGIEIRHTWLKSAGLSFYFAAISSEGIIGNEVELHKEIVQ